MRYNEEQLLEMSETIGEYEEEKCKNAISILEKVMYQLDYVSDNTIKFYSEGTYSYMINCTKRNTDISITLLVQGSYANKTNIPNESDVDIAVILNKGFIPKYRSGVTREDYNFVECDDILGIFKNDIHNKLMETFGNQNVERGNKSIKVKGNLHRVDVDIVPACRFRDYTGDFYNDKNNYVKGIVIFPDKGEEIINYPEQHIEMGAKKDISTFFYYKKCVRVIKTIKENMKCDGFIVSNTISSFGIESLLWNIDDSIYLPENKEFSSVLNKVIISLRDDSSNYCNYFEANGIKKLFNNREMEIEYKLFVNNLYDYCHHTILGSKYG